MWDAKTTLLFALTLSVLAAVQSEYDQQNPQELPSRDQSPVVRDAFEHGYQRSREDEAQQRRLGREQAASSDESRPAERRRVIRNGYGGGGLNSGSSSGR